MFTIAYRTITDRLRRGLREQPTEPAELPEPHGTDGPEHDLLRAELLAQLAHALEGLSQQERDGLALRFAARLSMAHVAEVLGTSIGAAKMMIHWAVRRFEERVATPAPAGQVPADLEAVIDDVLARGTQSTELVEAIVPQSTRITTLPRIPLPSLASRTASWTSPSS